MPLSTGLLRKRITIGPKSVADLGNLCFGALSRKEYNKNCFLYLYFGHLHKLIIETSSAIPTKSPKKSITHRDYVFVYR